MMITKTTSGDIESAFLLGVLLIKTAQKPEVHEIEIEDASSPESRASAVLKEIQEATQTARVARKIRLQKKKKLSTNSLEDEKTVKLSDNDLGLDWLQKASRENHGRAMCYLGNILLATEKNDDIFEALLWYEKGAILSPPQTDALFNLGTLYFEGREGIIIQDLPKSFNFFKRAADMDDLSSQFWVGYCYFTGEGMVKGAHGEDLLKLVDPLLALKYLVLCADKGHHSALYYLATLYRSGLYTVNGKSDGNDINSNSDNSSIQPDMEKFFKYLLLAVEAEDPDALYCLGDMYMNSADAREVREFVSRDEIKGLALYEKASGLGQIQVRIVLTLLMISLTTRLSDINYQP
jgi:TPR repeat protein